MSLNITLSALFLTHFSLSLLFLSLSALPFSLCSSFLSLLFLSLSAQLTLPEKLGAGAVWSQLTKVISEHQLASVQVSE